MKILEEILIDFFNTLKSQVGTYRIKHIDTELAVKEYLKTHNKMDKILKEIDKRINELNIKEKQSKTKILKAQYSASQTTLVFLKIWIKENI